MKSLTIHRLTSLFILMLAVSLSACDSLTGVDPAEPYAAAPEASTTLRPVHLHDETVVREIPEFATPVEILNQSFNPHEEARVVYEGAVGFTAAVMTERPDRVVVQIDVQATDTKIYYVFRQLEGEAPERVRAFHRSSLTAVTETLTREAIGRSVEYWVEDEGGTERTERIRFEVPARAQL